MQPLPIILIALALPITAGAQTQWGCHELNGDATYQEGCLDPCDCILWPRLPLTGTFNLRDIYFGGATCLYGLEDINFVAHPSDGINPVSTSFRGRGVQRIFFAGAGLIEVETRLLLSVDGTPARIFTTEPGATGDPFTEFRTVVADNDFFCYNIILDLAADAVNTPCPALCSCDYTADDRTDVTDLLLYLDLWFRSDLLAERTQSLAIEVGDLLDFLGCWFPAAAGEPCP